MFLEDAVLPGTQICSFESLWRTTKFLEGSLAFLATSKQTTVDLRRDTAIFRILLHGLP